MHQLPPSKLYRALALGLALAAAGCADNSQVIQEQAEIKKELAEIKKMIAERPAAPVQAQQAPQAEAFQPIDIDVSNAPFLGTEDAPVTLVEFTDYRCPFCKRHATTTLPQLAKEYIDSGKLKYVLKEFPLKSLHPDADRLSLAALCAGDQDRYWDMHNLLFSSRSRPNPKNLSKEVKALELDSKKFRQCIDSDQFAGQIQADVELGTSLGVSGTPSFFLGKTDSVNYGKVHASKQIKGAQGISHFRAAIDELLK